MGTLPIFRLFSPKLLTWLVLGCKNGRERGLRNRPGNRSRNGSGGDPYGDLQMDTLGYSRRDSGRDMQEDSEEHSRRDSPRDCHFDLHRGSRCDSRHDFRWDLRSDSREDLQNDLYGDSERDSRDGDKSQEAVTCRSSKGQPAVAAHAPVAPWSASPGARAQVISRKWK